MSLRFSKGFRNEREIEREREREGEMVVVTCKMKDEVNREKRGVFVVTEVGHAWVLDNSCTVTRDFGTFLGDSPALYEY